MHLARFNRNTVSDQTKWCKLKNPLENVGFWSPYIVFNSPKVVDNWDEYHWCPSQPIFYIDVMPHWQMIHLHSFLKVKPAKLPVFKAEWERLGHCREYPRVSHSETCPTSLTRNWDVVRHNTCCMIVQFHVVPILLLCKKSHSCNEDFILSLFLI